MSKPGRKVPPLSRVKLIILLPSNMHAWFKKPQRKGIKGWIIDDIAKVLNFFVENYGDVGRRKPEFTRAEVARIVKWILFKSKIEDAPYANSTGITGLTVRQRLFIKHYLSKAMGNRAKAARLAGYSPKRAKQTGYDLLSPRKRF